MKKLAAVVTVVTLSFAVPACSRQAGGPEVQEGTEVTVVKLDGVTIEGRLIEARPEHVVLQAADGTRTEVPRSQIRSLLGLEVSAAPPAGAAGNGSPVTEPAAAPEPGDGAVAPSAPAAAAAAPRVPEFREVTLPAGTTLAVELESAVGSDTSGVEDAVRGTVRRAVSLEGAEVIPAGTRLEGVVTEATRSGRVKGRARVAFRFTRIDLPGDSGRTAIRTAVIAREAEGTKKQDAAKIGGGAAGGAIVGGIVGGGDGAAKGAAIGGAAGTGVVLATRGKEVRLAPGTNVSVRLTQPLTIRVPVSRAG